MEIPRTAWKNMGKTWKNVGTFHVNGGLWLGDVPIATFDSGRVTSYAHCRGSLAALCGAAGVYILEPKLLN